MIAGFCRNFKLIHFLLVSLSFSSIVFDIKADDRKAKKKAVEVLRNNMCQDLRTSSLTKEGAAIRHAISDLRDVQIHPTYVCDLVCLPDCNSLTVLLESPLESLNCGRWGFSTFNESGDLIWPRFLEHRTFNAYLDETISKCMVTNSFQDIHKDTLILTVPLGGSPTRQGDPIKLFFALSPDGQVLLVRIEGPEGRSIYENLSGTESSMFMSSLMQRPFLFVEYDLEQCFNNATVPQILNRFMYLNSKQFDAHKKELEELHSSKRMQKIVEKLMKHEHPWVKDAANYYLVNFGSLFDNIDRK